ncbi:MAG TPA: hypothetical protein VF267_13595 [Gammaproteobacteria bacterium]
MTGHSENTANGWRTAGWAFATLLWLLPLIAMQFTDDVNWGPVDFAVMFVLIFGTGFAVELAVRKSRSTLYRVAAGIALVGSFLLAWLSVGVGIIGTEDGDPANLMYFGVLAIGLLGAAVTRLQARGMAKTALAMTLGQAAVAVIAIIGDMGYPGSGLFGFLGLNGFFVALFAGSSLLFGKAAE